MMEIFAPFTELSPVSLIVQSSHPPYTRVSLKKKPQLTSDSSE